MQTLIHAENIVFEKEEVKVLLEHLDKNIACETRELVYYPYLFCEFTLSRKWFNTDIGKKAGCTIDGIHSLGALVDKAPETIERVVKRNVLLDVRLDVVKGIEEAKAFLKQAISSRTKTFTLPKLVLVHHEVFYRPYWIVEGQNRKKQTFHLTVDAVSGKYHPL